MILLVFLKAHSGYWAENRLYREAMIAVQGRPRQEVAVVKGSRILEMIFKSQSDFLTHSVWGIGGRGRAGGGGKESYDFEAFVLSSWKGGCATY